MENLLDVAKYILNNINYTSDKKVQKITYYAYSWYLATYNTDPYNITNRLFEDHPEAWIHGPVFYNLYKEMNDNRGAFFTNENINLTEDTKIFLNKIISIYDRFTGNQLEDMTHNELPWNEARNGKAPHERSREQLKDEVIYSYFNA